MDISIVIPAHNEAGMIGQLLQSIARQRFDRRNLELIVVADRCTDETVAIARSFRVERIVEGAFGSPAAARNAGARLARGKLLVFLDADLVLPTRSFLSVLWREVLKQGSVVGTCLANPRERGLRGKFFWLVRNGLKKVGIARDSNSMLFVNRHIFRVVGGFRPETWPFEYYDFIRAVREQGARYMFVAEASVKVSMRRYERGGYIRTVGWWLIQTLRYNLGMKLWRPKPVWVWERERLW